MKRKSWFIWLSVIAFFLLWSSTSMQIRFSKRLKAHNHSQKTDDWDLWLHCLGNMFLGFATMAVPTILVLLLFPLLIPYLGVYGETIFEVFVFAILYFAGVLAAYRFDKWREEKFLPHVSKNDK